MAELSTLGERVAWARKTVALSQGDLEELAGVGQAGVHHIERGRIPNATTLASIATVLGASLEWLLAGKGKAPSPQQIAVAVVTAREAKRA